MAKISNARLDSLSKVIPICDACGDEQEINNVSGNDMQDHTIAGMNVDGGDVFSGEHNPKDRWLPITESRNGSTLSAAFHLLCSGIGIQVFSLPIAFVSLGWFWGILWLSLLFSWQLYTKWILVNLHESAPITGVRYSRYLHLSIVAFGPKMGKLLAMYPTMLLSGGTCVVYEIIGASAMEQFFRIMCDVNLHCQAKTLTGAEWFLVFICLAIFTAEFFPNLNSLAPISFIGSITAFAYCSLLWILIISKGRPDDHQMEAAAIANDPVSGVRIVWSALGIIALAFRGHNLVLEIQATMPTNREHPSHKSMWRGVTISYLLIAICMYPLAIVGHWAYGNKVPPSLGILAAFSNFHQHNTSKYIIGLIYLLFIINCLCTFQIYVMPTFDNLERIYITRKNKKCSRLVRSAIKLFYGGFAYFIAVAFPFLPSIAAFTGSFALPLTLVYPCFMWIAIKKPQRFSRMWCLNLGLGCSGAVLSVILAAAALWSLIVNGLDTNFFRPI